MEPPAPELFDALKRAAEPYATALKRETNNKYTTLAAAALAIVALGYAHGRLAASQSDATCACGHGEDSIITLPPTMTPAELKACVLDHTPTREMLHDELAACLSASTWRLPSRPRPEAAATFELDDTGGGRSIGEWEAAGGLEATPSIADFRENRDYYAGVAVGASPPPPALGGESNYYYEYGDETEEGVDVAADPVAVDSNSSVSADATASRHAAAEGSEGTQGGVARETIPA